MADPADELSGGLTPTESADSGLPPVSPFVARLRRIGSGTAAPPPSAEPAPPEQPTGPSAFVARLRGLDVPSPRPSHIIPLAPTETERGRVQITRDETPEPLAPPPVLPQIEVEQEANQDSADKNERTALRAAFKGLPFAAVEPDTADQIASLVAKDVLKPEDIPDDLPEEQQAKASVLRKVQDKADAQDTNGFLGAISKGMEHLTDALGGEMIDAIDDPLSLLPVNPTAPVPPEMRINPRTGLPGRFIPDERPWYEEMGGASRLGMRAFMRLIGHGPESHADTALRTAGHPAIADFFVNSNVALVMSDTPGDIARDLEDGRPDRWTRAVVASGVPLTEEERQATIDWAQMTSTYADWEQSRRFMQEGAPFGFRRGGAIPASWMSIPITGVMAIHQSVAGILAELNVPTEEGHGDDRIDALFRGEVKHHEGGTPLLTDARGMGFIPLPPEMTRRKDLLDPAKRAAVKTAMDAIREKAAHHILTGGWQERRDKAALEVAAFLNPVGWITPGGRPTPPHLQAAAQTGRFFRAEMRAAMGTAEAMAPHIAEAVTAAERAATAAEATAKTAAEEAIRVRGVAERAAEKATANQRLTGLDHPHPEMAKWARDSAEWSAKATKTAKHALKAVTAAHQKAASLRTEAGAAKAIPLNVRYYDQALSLAAERAVVEKGAALAYHDVREMVGTAAARLTGQEQAGEIAKAAFDRKVGIGFGEVGLEILPGVEVLPATVTQRIRPIQGMQRFFEKVGMEKAADVLAGSASRKAESEAAEMAMRLNGTTRRAVVQERVNRWAQDQQTFWQNPGVWVEKVWRTVAGITHDQYVLDRTPISRSARVIEASLRGAQREGRHEAVKRMLAKQAEVEEAHGTKIKAEEWRDLLRSIESPREYANTVAPKITEAVLPKVVLDHLTPEELAHVHELVAHRAAWHFSTDNMAERFRRGSKVWNNIKEDILALDPSNSGRPLALRIAERAQVREEAARIAKLRAVDSSGRAVRQQERVVGARESFEKAGTKYQKAGPDVVQQRLRDMDNGADAAIHTADVLAEFRTLHEGKTANFVGKENQPITHPTGKGWTQQDADGRWWVFFSHGFAEKGSVVTPAIDAVKRALGKNHATFNELKRVLARFGNRKRVSPDEMAYVEQLFRTAADAIKATREEIPRFDPRGYVKPGEGVRAPAPRKTTAPVPGGPPPESPLEQMMGPAFLDRLRRIHERKVGMNAAWTRMWDQMETLVRNQKGAPDFLAASDAVQAGHASAVEKALGSVSDDDFRAVGDFMNRIANRHPDPRVQALADRGAVPADVMAGRPEIQGATRPETPPGAEQAADVLAGEGTPLGVLPGGLPRPRDPLWNGDTVRELVETFDPRTRMISAAHADLQKWLQEEFADGLRMLHEHGFTMDEVAAWVPHIVTRHDLIIKTMPFPGAASLLPSVAKHRYWSFIDKLQELGLGPVDDARMAYTLWRSTVETMIAHADFESQIIERFGRRAAVRKGPVIPDLGVGGRSSKGMRPGQTIFEGEGRLVPQTAEEAGPSVEALGAVRGEEQPYAYKGETWFIPRQVHEGLQRLQDGFKQNDSGLLQSIPIWRWYTQMFKGLATGVFPRFHERNVISSAMNAWTEGVEDPAVYHEAFKVLNLPGRSRDIGGRLAPAPRGSLAETRGAKWATETVTGKGGTFTREQLRDEIRAAHITHKDEYSVMLEPDTGRGLKQAFGAKTKAEKAMQAIQGANPMSRDFKLLAAGREIGTMTEDWLRTAAYIDGRVNKGLGVQEAAARVIRIHLDYGDLTPALKFLRDNVSPFVVWKRKNLGFQIERLMKRPSKLYRLDLLRSYQDTLGNDDEAGDVWTPEYHRERWGFTYTQREGNKPSRTFYRPGAPMDDLNTLRAFLPASLGGKPVWSTLRDEIIWQMYPIQKYLFESKLQESGHGFDFFKNKPALDRRTVAPAYIMALDKVMPSWQDDDAKQKGLANQGWNGFRGALGLYQETVPTPGGNGTEQVWRVNESALRALANIPPAYYLGQMPSNVAAGPFLFGEMMDLTPQQREQRLRLLGAITPLKAYSTDPVSLKAMWLRDWNEQMRRLRGGRGKAVPPEVPPVTPP